MRKFGSSKRNPNPPWPGVQQGVVFPPGSKNSAIGRRDIDKAATDIEVREKVPNLIDARNGEIEPLHTRDGFVPIMSYMDGETASGMYSNGIQQNEIQSRDCPKMSVSDYLCNKKGNYARVEFLFGENNHIEKTGIIESVGKDFLVLTEAGTGVHIVCSSKNIKFINIYNLK